VKVRFAEEDSENVGFGFNCLTTVAGRDTMAARWKYVPRRFNHVEAYVRGNVHTGH